MNHSSLLKQAFILPVAAIFTLSSCSKEEDTMENVAACEFYVAGLAYQCSDNACEYIATLEEERTGVQSEISIDKDTYDHYKAVAEIQEANICWEGAM